jgi:hypothetical protein
VHASFDEVCAALDKVMRRARLLKEPVHAE